VSRPKLAAALRYAERGWPVFVLSRTKSPLQLCPTCPPHSRDHDGDECECLTCHGFYAATTDLARITEMLGRHPDGMLAVRTGAPSGTVVVDVDPRHGGHRTLVDLEDAGLLPATVRALTGGGGLHLVYAHPGEYLASGANRLGPGVDVKADRAYFVVAPSVHPATGKGYRWATWLPLDAAPTAMHPDLLERLRPPLVDPAPLPTRTTSAGGRGRFLGVLTRLLAAPEGERSDLLFWAARKTGTMHALGALPDLPAAVAALQDAGLRIGLTRNEVGDETAGTIGSGLLSAVNR
jgi:hypothetical protein